VLGNQPAGGSSELDQFEHEAAIMQRVRHKNLVELYGYSLQPRALVMELCSSGSLYAILHDPAFALLCDQLAVIKKFATGISAGMAHMHECGVIHRDLRTENVFIVFTPHAKGGIRVKVGDFNLAKEGEAMAQSLTMTECGTFQWIAPEIVREDKASEKVDVYSFAMVLWEITTREVPFCDHPSGPWFASLQAAFHGVRPGLQRVRHGEHFAPLIEACWENDHHLRLPFVEIGKRLAKIPRTTALKDALYLLPSKARGAS
jgi:serine/threonine protein kinase